MNGTIEHVEGIGKEFKKKLEYVGVKTVSELLAMTVNDKQREELSKRSGIPKGYLDNWATMLDLTRIEGIGYQYAELLTYSGIKSVEDFRKRSPENLRELIKKSNEEGHFSGTVPSIDLLNNFIQKSKQITNIVKRY